MSERVSAGGESGPRALYTRLPAPRGTRLLRDAGEDEPSLGDPGIDRAAESPIWLQLLRILETGIDSGAWSPGDRMPSEHELCRRFGVSRTSVREALGRLASAGVIRREQGRGAFVLPTHTSNEWMLHAAPALLGDRAEGGRSPLTSIVVRAERETLPSWAAAMVGDERGVGFALERIRSVSNRTAVHVVDYLPSRMVGIAPSLRDPRASLFGALEQVAGVTISRVRRTLEAAAADRVIARQLELEVGHPVVVVEAVAYDQNDRPVDVSRATVRTDRMRVAVESGFARFPHVSAGDDLHPPGGDT